MIYKVGIGHDLGDGALDIVVPQPRCPGVQATRRLQAADATIYEEAPFAELHFNILEDDDMYYDLLDQFGLIEALFSPVTVRLRNQFFLDGLFNGIAIRPEHGKEIDWHYFPRDVTLLIRDLEQLVEA